MLTRFEFDFAKKKSKPDYKLKKDILKGSNATCPL